MERSQLIVPYRTMSERLKHFAWLEVDHHNRLTARRRIAPSVVLSPVENEILKTVENFGGAASTGELVRSVQRTGASEQAARLALMYTPILRKIDRAVYVLRGRRLPVAAVGAAVKRSRAASDVRERR